MLCMGVVTITQSDVAGNTSQLGLTFDLCELRHTCRALRVRIKCRQLSVNLRNTMSAPTNHSTGEVDPVESIVPAIPVVLPLVGAVMMLLLAFIAVFMA